MLKNRREGRRSQKVNETPITEKGDETRIQATYTASLVVLVLVLVGAECKWCLWPTMASSSTVSAWSTTSTKWHGKRWRKEHKSVWALAFVEFFVVTFDVDLT